MLAKEENLKGKVDDGVFSIEAVGSLLRSNLEVAWSLLGIEVGQVTVKAANAWRSDRWELVRKLKCGV